MKTLTISLLLAFAAILPTTHAADPVKEKSLKHVVSFKFKKEATPEQIKKVEVAFAALKGKISVIAGLDWGTNNSPEGLNKGFTHCWVVTFKTEKDRDAYLVHPEHKAFVDILKPVLDEPFVIDFWTKE